MQKSIQGILTQLEAFTTKMSSMVSKALTVTKTIGAEAEAKTTEAWAPTVTEVGQEATPI